VGACKKGLRNERHDVFNTDQRIQFAVKSFTKFLEQYRVRISIDERREYRDSLFILPY